MSIATLENENGICWRDLQEYARSRQQVCVIDLETTGLSSRDEIVEIGLYDIGRCYGWQTFVQPFEKSANATAHITGITDDMVSDAPHIHDALGMVNEIAPWNDTLFVAYNGCRFDFPRLNYALETTCSDGVITDDRALDVLHLARKIIPAYETTSYKLVDIMKYYGVNDEQSHRAQDDCENTALVLGKLLDDPREQLSVPRHDLSLLVGESHWSRYPSKHEKTAQRLLFEIQKMESLPERDDIHLSFLYSAYNNLVKSLTV